MHICDRHIPRGIFDAFLGKGSTDDQEWEGPIFEPIDPDSDGGLGGTSEELFGPLAVLLVGYAQYEVDQFRTFMIDMDADMVKIITCTRKMLSSTLEQSLDSPAPVFEQLPLGTKRAVFLSGMSGAEVQEVISAYNDSGLPPTVWAAAVPANYQRTVSTLLEDIYGDHNLMLQREQELLRQRQQLS
ncbi:hypothetical protein COCOBI_18-1120 [Coccomyxa sp. Obi]|nr:hypothetical protein COCOBI_18-1120 [Coccomyxa sp. Obi]